MSWSKFDICGPCCGCKYHDDPFDRADSTNVGASYSETSGDWSILNNLLLIQAINAELTINVAHPDSLADGIIGFSFFAFNDGDEIVVRVDKVDADNCYIAKFTVGSPTGCIQLYRREGGTDTPLTSRRVAIPAQRFCTVLVYWGPRADGNNELSIIIPLAGDNVEASSVTAYVDPFTTDAKSIGTGTITSAVFFDDLTVWKHYSETNPDCSSASQFCDLIFDGFDDVDEIGCSWETTGTWGFSPDLNDGETDDAITSTSGAMLVSQNIHPVGHLKLTTVVQLSEVNDEARIWVEHEKLYVSLKITSTDEITTQLFDDGGAISEAIVTPFVGADDAYFLVAICYDGETVSYSVSFTSRLVAGAAAIDIERTGRAAIHYIGTGSFRVSYGILSRSGDECGGCSLSPPSTCCSGSSSEKLPPALRVEFPSAIFADNKCDTCASATSGAIVLVQTVDDPCVYEATCCACDSWAHGLDQDDLDTIPGTVPAGTLICGRRFVTGEFLGHFSIGEAILQGRVEWFFRLTLGGSHPFEPGGFGQRFTWLQVGLRYVGSREPLGYEGGVHPPYVLSGLASAIFVFLQDPGPCLEQFPMVLDRYDLPHLGASSSGCLNVAPDGCQVCGDLSAINGETCLDSETAPASITVWNDS